MGNCLSTKKSNTPISHSMVYNTNTNNVHVKEPKNTVKPPIVAAATTLDAGQHLIQQHNRELINAINSRQITLTINENPPLNNYLQQQQQQVLMLQQQLSPQMNDKPDDKANFIALFDYEKATKDDMTIKKNDLLFVIDKSHPDWWLAKNLRTQETGYVPYNYITSVDNLEIKE